MTYCSPIVRLLFAYCSPIVRLLFVYCSSIVRLGPLFFHNILNIEEQEKRLPEVQFTDNAIDNFLAYVDHMSCSADTYVSLGGSNGCADQLTNWDGTQKVRLGAVLRKKPRGLFDEIYFRIK